MKLSLGIVLLIATVVFFFVLSLPLNYLASSYLGVENATALMSAIYIILTAITFGVLFYKEFF